MALEHCYQQYRKRAAFFITYLAERDPGGYWLNVSDTLDLNGRAQQAKTCRSSQGLTIPRLLDDVNGTADYLFRAFPFRLCIIDINGHIAYYSQDEGDYQRNDLDKVIAKVLNQLHANGGKVTAQMLAQGRCDAVGKTATGFWLPRVEYFAQVKALATGARDKTVEIPNARGQLTPVSIAKRDELQRKRAQVVRLFTRGANPRNKPVVLIFANARQLPSGASTAAVQRFYQQQQRKAECYLIYTAPNAELAMTAKAAAAWRKAGKLTLPCALDDPEGEIAYAYGAQSPRVFVVARDGAKRWVVRYASKPGANNLRRALEECAVALQKIVARPSWP